MKSKWTIDGDETSWTPWAENMSQAPVSSLVQELIASRKVYHQEWALDLGCGTGRAFSPLASSGYQVIGIDPTANGLLLSRQRAFLAGIAAYPLQASAAQIPLPNASIDIVLAAWTLFHLSFTELASTLTMFITQLQEFKK